MTVQKIGITDGTGPIVLVGVIPVFVIAHQWGTIIPWLARFWMN